MNAFPLVISAPSGGGKTTITKRLLSRRDDVGYSVSCTTRAPRVGEVNGVDYHFLSAEEFLGRRGRGEFAEWAEVHGHLYGTLRASVQRLLDDGRHVLMDIDVQGAAQFAKSYPASVLVFLLPPSADVLVERLQARSTENGAEVMERLKNACDELREVVHYQYVVVNDDLEAAVARVSSIVDAEEVRRERVHALDAQVAGLVERLEQEIAGFTPRA